MTISLPAWVSTRDLDAEQFFLPSIPRGQGDLLRDVAAGFRDAMQPASYDQRRDILRELRLGTVPRNESEAEARASFAKLIEDLRDVPTDILRDACTAYANEPGTRFFPRGAGELRAFTNPLMARRSIRAHRLDMMAKASDEEFDESTRVTPEQMEAIKAEFGLVTNPYPDKPKPARHLRQPTAADLAEVAKDMGIPISTGRIGNAPPIQGLSIAEIFAQRDARRVVEFAPSAPDDEDWERHCA